MGDVMRVFWTKDLVGELRLKDRRDFVFHYAKSWVDNPKALPLSVRLPLREKEFSDDACRTFFVNLLPEGEIRAAIGGGSSREAQVAHLDDGPHVWGEDDRHGEYLAG